MTANIVEKHFRGVRNGPHHPSLPPDVNPICVFDIYGQTNIENLPEDWKEHILRLLINLHKTSMPEEIRLKAIVLVGEMIDCGFWY